MLHKLEKMNKFSNLLLHLHLRYNFLVHLLQLHHPLRLQQKLISFLVEMQMLVLMM
jgi:hypothetical protein